MHWCRDPSQAYVSRTQRRLYQLWVCGSLVQPPVKKSHWHGISFCVKSTRLFCTWSPIQYHLWSLTYFARQSMRLREANLHETRGGLKFVKPSIRSRTQRKENGGSIWPERGRRRFDWEHVRLLMRLLITCTYAISAQVYIESFTLV